MSKIILKNITLKEKPVDILVEGAFISRIVPAGSDPVLSSARTDVSAAQEVMDCTGKVAVPGFINMHTHAAMTLMRGVSEDQKLEDWLSTIWSLEDRIDSNFVHWGSKVACLEMMKTGTTTYNDQYWYPLASHQAGMEMGLRPVVSYVILDRFDRNEAARQKDQCQIMYEGSLRWPERSIFAVSAHSVYTVSEEMLLWVSEFVRKRGLKLHIHLSESRAEFENCKAAHGGLTPTEYLDSLGILDENVIAAHTLWLSDNDVEILGRRHVNCVHNVNSNLKLSSGYRFKYHELMDAGANVCIGTDGCASSNNLDMLEAMKTSALLQKAWREDPTAMPLGELLDCATRNGARALGLKSGSIKEGYLADIMIVDTDNTYFLSPGPFLANFLYSAHSDTIHSLICNGNFLIKNHKYPEEEEILANARDAMKILTKQN